MEWDTLFSMQQKLDTYILKHHQLEQKNLYEEKFLALLVELGELANETRCFKFWSNKSASNKEVILEEYVDNIHFLMSIGLEKGYTFTKIDSSETFLDETMHFNYVFASCMEFYKNPSETTYVNMFREYLHLAKLLGFSEEEIIQAYDQKNEVNYARQQNGY